MGYLPPIKNFISHWVQLEALLPLHGFPLQGRGAPRFQRGFLGWGDARGWRGLWFLYSISSFLWSLNIFENQQLQLFFPHCLMCFFRGTIGIIYQTYIHKIWIAVWFSKNLLTKFDIVWSYFEPFYFRQSGNWRVPQGRSQGSMTDQGGDTITHTQVLNCRCRVCTWFVTGLYPVTNPK